MLFWFSLLTTHGSVLYHNTSELNRTTLQLAEFVQIVTLSIRAIKGPERLILIQCHFVCLPPQLIYHNIISKDYISSNDSNLRYRRISAICELIVTKYHMQMSISAVSVFTIFMVLICVLYNRHVLRLIALLFAGVFK